MNDLNQDIYNIFSVMKNNYDEFIKELEYVFLGQAWFEEYRERQDSVGRAIFYFMCNHLSWTGDTLKNFPNSINICRHFRKDLMPWKKKLDNLIFYKIFNLDFHEFYEMIIRKKIAQEERLNYILYADPPYFVQGKHYRHSFSVQDHIDLASYHNQLKNRLDFHIIISYDNHPEILKLYDGWYVKEISYKTSIDAKSMTNYTELLISNRPITKYVKNKRLDEFANNESIKDK